MLTIKPPQASFFKFMNSHIIGNEYDRITSYITLIILALGTCKAIF